MNIIVGKYLNSVCWSLTSNPWNIKFDRHCKKQIKDVIFLSYQGINYWKLRTEKSSWKLGSSIENYSNSKPLWMKQILYMAPLFIYLFLYFFACKSKYVRIIIISYNIQKIYCSQMTIAYTLEDIRKHFDMTWCISSIHSLLLPSYLTFVIFYIHIHYFT